MLLSWVGGPGVSAPCLAFLLLQLLLLLRLLLKSHEPESLGRFCYPFIPGGFILVNSDPWVEKQNLSVSSGLAPFTKQTPGPGEGQHGVLLGF